MDMIYRRADIRDLDLLTEIRVQVLRAANHLTETDELAEVRANSRSYYRRALPEGAHAAFLAFDGERFAATGGVSFYAVMPTCCNPSGQKAYLMNIYTCPEYRRKGVAYRMVDLLVKECLARDVTFISLEATDMGRPLYEKYGFRPMRDEMLLPPERCLSLASRWAGL